MMFAFIRSIMISWQGLIGRSNKTKSNTCTLIIANQTSFFLYICILPLFPCIESGFSAATNSGGERLPRRRRSQELTTRKRSGDRPYAAAKPQIARRHVWTVFISVSNNYRTYLSQIFRFPKRINFQRMLMVSTREEKKLILVKEKNLRMEKKKKKANLRENPSPVDHSSHVQVCSGHNDYVLM